MKTTVQIPVYRLPELTTAFEKLNEKAIKLGCKPAYVTFGENKFVTIEHNPDSKVKLEVTETTIEYEIVKLNGWEFIGTLDHELGNVIVKPVPGKTVPSKYFTADHKDCDHCHIKRARKETFIVRHESGETKQVGRNCLKDFLGIDPAKILSLLGSIGDLFREFEERDWFGGGKQYYSIDLDKMVEASVVYTGKHGYISKAKADERIVPSTADIIRDYFFGDDPFSSYYKDLREEINSGKNEESSEKALKVIGWAKKQAADNADKDFWHNIQTFIELEAIPSKYFGYLVCLPALWHKACEEEKEHEKELNEYFGAIGKRVTEELEITSVNHSESYYGYTTIFNLKDKAGHSFVWFASGQIPGEKGESGNAKFTIKDHKEYKGRKQTIVNRLTWLS